MRSLLRGPLDADGNWNAIRTRDRVMRRRAKLRSLKIAGGSAALAATAVAGRSILRSLSAAGYRGPVSDHFDGRRFHNLEPSADKGIYELLRWQLQSAPSEWRWQDVVRQDPPPERVGHGALRATFVNHSTVLLQFEGLNVLTDPIWSRRTSPFRWAGPARFHAPGVSMADLPSIDVILISHNHFDHLDIPTLRTLSKRDHPLICAGLGNREFLERNGVHGAFDLDWWEGLSLSNGVTVTAVPIRHWSTRTRLDLRKTLWTGFVLSSPSGGIYFPGDTGFGRHFQDVRDRFGPFRLALLPIGSFLPRWFMMENHLSPGEAAAAHHILGARTSIAIHFGTFNLGDDSQTEARDEMQTLIEEDPALEGRFWILKPGEGREVPP